jgi:phosphoglycolate phosphatase-like HAD superfamily hydrolase
MKPGKDLQVLRYIRLLILDLDYVVFDCVYLKAHALKQCIAALNETYSLNISLPGRVDVEKEFCDYGFRWIRSLGNGLDEERQMHLEQAYGIHEIRMINSGAGRLHPGIKEFAVKCRQSNLAVALGADARRDYMLAVVDRHELDSLFQFALCTEEFGSGDAAEMMEEIMLQAEVNPSETLALGTRPHFFQSAKSVDIRTIGCGWGIGNHGNLADADMQALTLEQLFPAIQKADDLAFQRLD